MSSSFPSPMGPATAAKRGSMSAAHYSKLDALPANATLEARLGAIESLDTSQSAAISTLQGQAHAAVTLGAVGATPNANGASLAGQVLTLQPADSTFGGIVTAIAQAFAGAKTFVAEAVFSAGLVATGVRSIGAALLLRSDLGAGATDKCVVVGTTTADGSVDAAAKLWVAATGIGGTQVDKAWLTKRGDFTGGSFHGIGGLVPLRGRAGAGTDVILRLDNSGAVALLTFDLSGNLNIIFGGLNLYGTDSTGTPGAATINKPTGKSAIAAGASSVVITNSLVTAAKRVMITPHARDATCKELIVVPAAGSFTVSGSAAATATLPFSWEVSAIL